jgi:hypothetical protein
MIKEIMELKAKGLSMAKIAQELNVTKGVIAGLLFRSKNDPVKRVRPPAVKKISVSGSVSSDIHHSIIDLKPHHCRFIKNDDTSKPIYCCKPVVARSYCAEHMKLCYYSLTKKGGRMRWQIRF